MNLSMTTDYCRGTGNPQPFLERIARAGFTHVHWCHQWCTDFAYSAYEVAQIKKWFNAYNLALCDLHATAGNEKCWSSLLEYERQAGVELVKNRIDMCQELGGDVIIMHVFNHDPVPGQVRARMLALRRSLDELEPHARQNNLKIAVENGDFALLKELFSAYDPLFLGLCYDSGHGNLDAAGLDMLESAKDRLISVHLHDNNGKSDLHNLPFTGTVNWERLAGILAASAYEKCMSFETTMKNAGIADEEQFLQKAFAAGTHVAAMVERSAAVLR